MIRVRAANEQGFIVISVIVLMLAISIISLLLIESSSQGTTRLAVEEQRETLSYTLQSGMQHAKWQLMQNSACTGYTDIATTTFGDHSYAATVTPTDGSPVTLSVTAALDSGVTDAATQSEVVSYMGSSTLILQPGSENKDSFIEGDSGHQDHNKGSDDELKTNSETGEQYRSLLQFDLSAIPASANIVSADFEIYQYSNSGLADEVSIHGITRDWVEDEVTWIERRSGFFTNWLTAGGDYQPTSAGSFVADSIGWKSADIRSLVQQWVDIPSANHGMMLLSEAVGGNNEKRYHSSDYSDPILRPKLTNVYACECGMSCDATESMAPLAHWKFDDGSGSTAIDSVGGHDGSVNGAAWSGGTLDGALSFDAANDYVDVPANPYLEDVFDGGATLTAWIRPAGWGENDSGRIVDKTDNVGSGDRPGWHLTLSGTQNTLAFQHGFSGSYGSWSAPSGALSLDSWQHVAVVYDGSSDTETPTLYINGVAQTTAADSNPSGFALTDAGLNLRIGNFAASTSRTFDGLIDDVRLYNRMLDATEIAELAVRDKTLLLVVADATSINAEETLRKDLIESWGYTVNLIDDSDSQANYDAAAVTNNVVYVSQTVVSTQLNDKLRNVPIGVVDEEQQVYDELGFGGAYTSDHSMTDIDITNNSHQITSGYAFGNLKVTSSDQSMHYLSGALSPDLEVLANYPSSSYPILAVLDVGDTLYGGGNAAGRRVWLPWGGNIFQFAALNGDGQIIMQRSIEWAANNTPTFGPFAHWKLDEITGVVATDSVGGNDGALINGPVWTAGMVDGGLSFDGNNDYIDVSSLNPRSYDDFTISAWYKSADTSVNDDEYIYVHPEGFITDGIAFGPTDDGSDDDKLRLTIDIDDVAGRHYGTSDIVDQQWHHLVAVRANGRVKLYVDSIEESDDVDVHTGMTVFVDGDGPFIGDFPGGTEQVHGVLDDIRLYDRALTAAEISDLFTTASGGGGGGGGGGGSCSGTFRDEFNNQTYSGDDGTLSWATDWLEVGESNDAVTGDIQVRNDQSNYQLRTRDSDNGGEGVERELDLSGAGSASISYEYRRENLDTSTDYTAVEVSSNGAAGPWTELARHGTNNDSSYQSTSHNLNGHIANDTRIRFKTSSTMGGTDTVWFDNVEIVCAP